MNRPGKATRSHGKPSDDDDETTGLGLPVSLKRQIESYAVMHHMTPTQVLAEGVKLLLKQEALQQGRMNRAKPKARPCNKPFDAEERQYLCGLDAVDECGEKRITWNRYFIRYVEYELELGARPVDVFRSAGVGPEVIYTRGVRLQHCGGTQIHARGPVESIATRQHRTSNHLNESHAWWEGGTDSKGRHVCENQ